MQVEEYAKMSMLIYIGIYMIVSITLHLQISYIHKIGKNHTSEVNSFVTKEEIIGFILCEFRKIKNLIERCVFTCLEKLTWLVKEICTLQLACLFHKCKPRKLVQIPIRCLITNICSSM